MNASQEWYRKNRDAVLYFKKKEYLAKTEAEKREVRRERKEYFRQRRTLQKEIEIEMGIETYATEQPD